MQGTESTSIGGREWLLTGIADGDGAVQPPVAGSRASLVIDGDRIAGNASCNRFFCDGPLDAIPELIGLTMMMCPEPVMEQERRYLELLHRIETWSIANDQLIARDERGTVILVWSTGDVSPREPGDRSAD